MNLNYQTLFSIQLRHDYYADNRCVDFQIVPTADCQAACRRFGLGLRVFTDQVIVYYEQLAGETAPRIALDRNMAFTFGLYLKSSTF